MQPSKNFEKHKKKKYWKRQHTAQRINMIIINRFLVPSPWSFLYTLVCARARTVFAYVHRRILYNHSAFICFRCFMCVLCILFLLVVFMSLWPAMKKTVASLITRCIYILCMLQLIFNSHLWGTFGIRHSFFWLLLFLLLLLWLFFLNSFCLLPRRTKTKFHSRMTQHIQHR